jgi:hypothetical protein
MMEPTVWQMIVCEDARVRKGTQGKIDVLGVMNVLRAPADAFPMRLSCSIFLCLTDCRGNGRGAIVIANDETDEEAYIGESHSFKFGSDPVKLFSVTLRVPLCVLPSPGLYRVEFVYNESVIGKCPLLVKETP